MADAAGVRSGTRAASPALGLILGSLFRADVAVLRRSSRTLLLNIVVPILYLVITHLQLGRGGITHFSAELSISLALSVGLVSSSLNGYSTAIAQDRSAGVFRRLRITPAPGWAIMGSRLLVQIIADLIMTVIVLIVGSVLHGTVFSAGQYLLVVGVSILGGAMFLAIAQALVGLITSPAAVNAVARVLFVVLLLLGLLGPSGILGSAVRDIADGSPIGALINLYGGALATADWDWTNTAGLLATVGYAAAGAFVGIRWFRWDSY